jgi:hypothetical protein
MAKVKIKSLDELLGALVSALNRQPPVPASLPKLKEPKAKPAQLKGYAQVNEEQLQRKDRRKAALLSLSNKKSVLENTIEEAKKRKGTSGNYLKGA